VVTLLGIWLSQHFDCHDTKHFYQRLHHPNISIERSEKFLLLHQLMVKSISDPGVFQNSWSSDFEQKNGLGNEFSTKKRLLWGIMEGDTSLLLIGKKTFVQKRGEKYLRHLHRHTEKKKQNTEKKADKRKEVQHFTYVVNQLKTLTVGWWGKGPKKIIEYSLKIFYVPENIYFAQNILHWVAY